MSSKTQNTLIGAAVVIGVVFAIMYLKKQNDKKKLATTTITTPAA